MVATLAVGIAAFFQLVGGSVFLNQPEDKCSPAPNLASLLFLLANLLFLWDISIYPRRFMHMSIYWQLFIETMAAIFLSEVGTLIIWCGVERAIFSLTSELLWLAGLSGCEPWKYEYWLLGLITTALSGALLWYILEATDGMYLLEKLARNLKTNWRDAWNMMVCFYRMNNADRRRALKVCKLATKHRRSRRCPPPMADEDDDDDDDDDDDC